MLLEPNIERCVSKEAELQKEVDTGWCASKDARSRRGVDCEIPHRLEKRGHEAVCQ